DDNMRRANRVTLIGLIPATLLAAFATGPAQDVGLAVLLIATVAGMLGTLAVYVLRGLRIWDTATTERVFPWPCLLMCNGMLCLVAGGVAAGVLGTLS
ncbi:MAG: hypothetical protein AAFY46_13475, partial [Planctomycetota bacterium]